MFPQIETDRLRLREIEQDDAASLFAYFSTDEVTRYYGQDSFQQIEQAEDLIKSFSASYDETKGIRWGIEHKETNELIGTIGFHLLSLRHKRAEIGYDLHPEHWGKGYASEAVKAAISYGFEVMELTRIGAVVFIENEASSKLLLKLGFEKEGVLRDYMYQNGTAHDTYIYSLLKVPVRHTT
ncbi:GNAT family N-acetyltransferase [Sporosarcina cascadiensis]|uniref:GNAT family N-acetyltransferase n=1 Tax=Sporosarcina cascadiensis TaxID=2660747 RepID=UPI00129B03C1|nr:GNAT family protein [Sporosarcina cascadiensis]